MEIAKICFIFLGFFVIFVGLSMTIFDGIGLLATDVLAIGVTMVVCGFWIFREEPRGNDSRKEEEKWIE